MFDEFHVTEGEIKEIYGSEEILDNINDFDPLTSFNNALKLVTESLKIMAEDQTIVFVVDELDRCMPDYAIKVLERLHHISHDDNNIHNLITIIAVDENSMINSIKSTYGYSDDYAGRNFFKKFVRFSLKLGRGSPEDCTEKYYDYTELFGIDDVDTFDKYISVIFKEFFEKLIVIRDQEIIFEKVYTVHRLTSETENDYDYTVMYMELLLATFYYLKYEDNDIGILKVGIDKIIDENRLNHYDEDSGLKVIQNNIWHILKYYVSFLFTIDDSELSEKSEHITEFNLKNNLIFLKSFKDQLKHFI